MAINSHNLREFLVPELVYGQNAILAANRFIKNFGNGKVLLVTDNGISEAGWLHELKEAFDAENVTYTVFKNVTSNPRDYEVKEGAEYYLAQKCNIIVALGGGSVIDCAKGIGILVANGGNILDYEGVDLVKTPIPPLICIPTTGGTSADVSQFAIIKDTERKVKIAIISKSIVPDVSLLDPRVLSTMDNYLTATTGIDAMVHAIEAFVSNANSSLTDIHSLHALELLYRNLPLSIDYPENLQYRAAVMQGSLEAGMAFSNASLGAVHAMAHSLGGLLDLPHGECNAILLNHVVKYNFKAAPERFSKLAQIFGIPFLGLSEKEKIKVLTEFIDSFIKSLGVKNKLSDAGVSHADIPELSEKALADPCIVTNPRRPNKRDLEVIYEEAF